MSDKNNLLAARKKITDAIDSKNLNEDQKLKALKALKSLDKTDNFYPSGDGSLFKAKQKLNKQSFSTGLDSLQTSLTALGLTPALGVVPDIANTVISAARGNFVDAGVNLASAVPVAGQAVGATKLGMKAVKTAAKGKATADLYKDLASINSKNPIQNS
jgi:hypothetical protein